jgi:bacterioferritin (cytochrome b1)
MEGEMTQLTDNENQRKVKFLMQFVRDLATNVTGDSAFMSTQLQGWKARKYLDSSLAEWQSKVTNLIGTLRKQSDMTSSTSLDLTQELLRKLDEHTRYMESFQSLSDSWGSWAFYWVSVLSLIGGCIAVVFFYSQSTPAIKGSLTSSSGDKVTSLGFKTTS